MWKYGQSAFATSCTFFRASFGNGLQFDHRFRSSRSLFAWLVQKKEIITKFTMALSNTPEKTAKNSASEWFVSLTDEDVESFVEADANKNTRDAQRRSIDEVVFARWKRNKTTPRYTAARIRRLSQQTSIVCEINVWWWTLTNNNNVRQLNRSRGTCLSDFLN